MTLEQLIDDAIKSGQWYGITIFADRTGEGPRVNLLRDVATGVTDQTRDPDELASAKLRRMLERHAGRPLELFDDLLG